MGNMFLVFVRMYVHNHIMYVRQFLDRYLIGPFFHFDDILSRSRSVVGHSGWEILIDGGVVGEDLNYWCD